MERLSVEINELCLKVEGNRQRLSAKVDGEVVWFDFPASIAVELRGEIFIAVALLEAMISNLPIELGEDVIYSPTLLEQFDQLQSVYRSWNPDLSKVIIQGGQLEASTSNGKVASFYSGGVDGAYTLCKHREELSSLITISGFDTISKSEQWPLLINKNKTLAGKFDLELIDVENNIRQFMRKRKISNNFQHGLTLAGIAITLGFKKVH